VTIMRRLYFSVSVVCLLRKRSPGV